MAQRWVTRLPKRTSSRLSIDVACKEEVDAEDIAEIVERWTGIPVNRMLESERTKLLHLEDRLHELRGESKEELHYEVQIPIDRKADGLTDAILAIDPDNATAVDLEEKKEKK